MAMNSIVEAAARDQNSGATSGGSDTPKGSLKRKQESSIRLKSPSLTLPLEGQRLARLMNYLQNAMLHLRQQEVSC